MFELAYHPSDAQIAYATTRGAVFRTQDGGVSWTRASDGIVASSVYPLPLVLDREAPATLYTFDSSLRLYRTDNGGGSWRILADDLPEEFLFGVISDVAGTTDSLFIGGVSQTPTGQPQLFKSSDGGLSFQRLGTGLPADASIATITVDPLDANVVYVGVYGTGAVDQASLFRSDDGGASFTPNLNLFSTFGYQPDVQDMSFIPGTGNSGSLFAVINYQVFHSADGGAIWTGPHGPSERITAHPSDPLKAYLARSDGAFVWFAPDPTPSVLPFSEGLTPNPSYLSIPGAAALPAAVWRLVPQPGYPAPGTFLVATTDGAGLFLRADAAPSWLAASNHPAGAGVRALAVHSHPSLTAVDGSAQLLAGHSGFATSSPGLYRSLDQGLSWAPFNTGLRAVELQVLRIDPSSLDGTIDDTIMVAGGASSSIDGSYAGAGLLRSTDNGATWTTLDGDLPLDATDHAYIGLIRDLVFDPRSCVSPPANGPCSSGGLRTLYALAEGFPLPADGGPATSFDYVYRLVRSADLGVTWVALDGDASGLPPSFSTAEISQRITPSALIIDPNDSNRLWLGTQAIYDDFDSGDGINPQDFDSGIFHSSDGGASWTHLDSNGLPNKDGFSNTQLDVTALLIDPSDPNILWAALTDLRSTGYSTVFRSADGGVTWLRHDEGMNGSVELRALAFDPQDPNVLYAAAGGYEANPGAVYRGIWDSGTQSVIWLSISVGLPAESTHSIVVDPFDSNLLHAGTDAGVVSIRRLTDTDNDGIPDEIEDQAPIVPGGLEVPGDGNGDLQRDSRQRDVGSIGVSLRRPEGSASSISITTDVVGGSGSADCSAGDVQTVDVQRVEPTTLGLDPVAGSADLYAHPFGNSVFEVLGCSQADVRIRYHGAEFDPRLWTFRVFAPLQVGDPDTLGWHDFSAQAVRIGNDSWQLDLSAGGFGSYRPETDAIRFVGGPACYNPTIFSDGVEAEPRQLAICPE